jgi:hypothetical protein
MVGVKEAKQYACFGEASESRMWCGFYRRHVPYALYVLPAESYDDPHFFGFSAVTGTQKRIARKKHPLRPSTALTGPCSGRASHSSR